MIHLINSDFERSYWYNSTFTWDKNTMYVSSELKALEGKCQKIEIFPPGKHTTVMIKIMSNGTINWMNFDTVKTTKQDWGFKEITRGCCS